MAESIAQSELFKKLGFDNSSQWLLYDDRFTSFFKFLAENINDKNVLSEHEVLEQNELQSSDRWLDDETRHFKLQELEAEHPGLLTLTDGDIENIKSDIAYTEQLTGDYTELIEDMRQTNHSLNSKIGNLKHSLSALNAKEQQLLSDCQSKVKQLEDLQRENYKLCAESKRLFTKIQTPPLFMHQMPMDQYLLKWDSFMQHFMLYMKENYKIQDGYELDNSNEDLSTAQAAELDKLNDTMQYYTLELLKEQAKVKATEALIEQLDLKLINCLQLPDMVQRTQQMQLQNEHQLRNAHETLLNDLAIHVQQHARQRVELVLYENTKQKLARALRRREHNDCLTKIISDALSNADLIWLAIQLDLERTRNRVDSTDALHSKAQACGQRMQLMRLRNINHSAGSAQLLLEIASLLGSHMDQPVRADARNCLYEYEKLGRLIEYTLSSLLHRKPYASALALTEEFKRASQQLAPYVYDSPVLAPMFVHARYLPHIYNVKMANKYVEQAIRQLRTRFQEEITLRMERDKLWRYKQLLWIYFLTEPPRMLHAIEEAKKGSAKVAAIPNFKPQISSARMKSNS